MKKTILFAFVAVVAFSCNNEKSDTPAATSDTTKTEVSATTQLDYPYQLDKPYQDWQPGDQKHAVMVMKMLKAWETNNLTECVSYFGDSLDISLDMYHQVLPHDSIINVLNMSWADMTSIKVKMQDWESVISKDKKNEWVTLWYKQTWVDKKGKADSLQVINDAKIVNGKISVFDEKIQHYPAVKK